MSFAFECGIIVLLARLGAAAFLLTALICMVLSSWVSLYLHLSPHLLYLSSPEYAASTPAATTCLCHFYL